MNTVLCPILALAVNVIVQVVAFRLRRGAHFFRSIVEGFLSGAVVFAILEAALAPGGDSFKEYMVVAILVNAPIYLALSYCAYNFIQLGQTSIRIRMYSEIAAKPSGASVEEMKREYDDKALMQARLRRLIESGDIIEKNGRYIVGRKRFLHISNVLFAVKRILLGKESEFE
jgi:hypothetical protein